MIKKKITLLLLFLNFLAITAQTTDLAIVVEAKNSSGADISQVHIYQEYQYLVTIINSGNSVANATFSQTINQNVTVLSTVSQNNIGGASPVTGFNLINNTLTGTVASLPSNSSVEIKVSVVAPINIGGIATSATVFSPEGTQDINPSNNQSIISTDVVDVDIDFTVTHSQVTPPEGTGISMWNDSVAYEFTITNNSSINYPLSAFSGVFQLSSLLDYGRPVVQQTSIECLVGTNGSSCPDLNGVSSNPTIISSVQTVFTFGNPIEFTSGGSLTFRVVYQFLEPLCALEQQPISVNNYIKLTLNHSNISSNNSNLVATDLLIADLCQLTDICIETLQIDPSASTLVDWEEEITFRTTVCNNGPLPAPIRFFLQNLSVNIEWEVVSLTCISTTGPITCNDFTLTEQNTFWTSNEFIMPVGATITIETVVIFYEPECSTSTTNSSAHIRSGTNVLDSQIIDTNIANSAESDYVILPPAPTCASSDLQITKTQTIPTLPEGGSATNTTDWGSVTYEITVTNPSDSDTFIEVSDYMPLNANQFVTGTLLSVNCISTTGTATCGEIEHTNIGVPLDGVPQDGVLDVFWEILPEDNWALPAQSSITFEVVIDWAPECTTLNIAATNSASVNHVGSVIDNNNSNNIASVVTYFAPCVDLIVQTFPQFTQVNTNQNFDWIVDITNSTTSSNAVDIYFEDVLSSVFTITGTPTCQITSGTAICISSFNINGNIISGTIPNMEAGSTVRIRIPVTSPVFGGAFSNTAEATPSETDNEELTPETNISISNVQVIAPTLIKSFNPIEIVVGQTSTLTFTITNISSNPSQNNISFTDNLPFGLILVDSPVWVSANGCTATFLGAVGDPFVGVSNLTFPNGVSSCTFSVIVTSNTEGVFLNDNENFSNQNNIDTSQANATLTVLEDTSNVDIEVLKNVFPEEVSIGDEVAFTITITNIGTTTATQINILESLPSGYQYISSSSSIGTFNYTTSVWSVDVLTPNESAALTIIAQVISSNDLLNIAQLQNLNEIDRDDSNNEDSAEVTINNCLEIQEGVSPNTDGYNDFLIIPCIEDYPNHIIKIYNRLGVQIYQSDDYKNNWDGKSNMGFPQASELLPVGTYYYILEIEGLPKPIMGWVYLNY